MQRSGIARTLWIDTAGELLSPQTISGGVTTLVISESGVSLSGTYVHDPRLT
jgi:hypothetical protein